MKKKLIFLFLFINTIFSIDFSKNNVIKFSPNDLKEYNHFQDYDNILIISNYIKVSDNTNYGWLITEILPYDPDYIIDSFFINFDYSSDDDFIGNNDFIRINIREVSNDKIIISTNFTESGGLYFSEIIDFPIYLYLEIKNSNCFIKSFGFTRKQKIFLNNKEIIVEPEILYIEENLLKIKFNLYYPQIIDIILFDKKGNIISYLVRKKYFKSGYNEIIWKPDNKIREELMSGTSYLYFCIYINEETKKEIIKNILLINK